MTYGKVTLIYGGAGSGKTNLCLWVMSRSSEPSLYLSTEGPLPTELLERYSLLGKQFYFKELFGLEDMSIQLVNMFLSSLLGTFKNICVDSINAHYRYEVMERVDANKLLNTALSILSHASTRLGLRVLLVAQVREEEGEIVPSGYEILDFWSDIIIAVSKDGSKRIAEVIKPREIKGLRVEFSISNRGIEFGELH